MVLFMARCRLQRPTLADWDMPLGRCGLSCAGLLLCACLWESVVSDVSGYERVDNTAGP